MKIYLYKIINIINGKIYIGQTKDISKRWQKHCHRADCNSNRALSCSIRKYGEENFIIETLGFCYSRKVADLAEKSLIAYWNKKCKMYNRAIGGEGGIGWSCTNITKAKHRNNWKNKRIRKLRLIGMSKAWKNNYISRCANISKALTGRKLSLKHRKNIGLASKKRWSNPEYRYRLSISHM